jgi:tetraprenyl-beta-curcumene synthase
LPAAAREMRRWRRLAGKIPDAELRQDALYALAGKRGQSDGAALYAIVPRARNLSLLRLVLAYQLIWDFLDEVSERGARAGAGAVNGRQMHLALIDALDPARPVSDYYLYHPWHDDGGYLAELVAVCRECCAALPSYERVKPYILREARRAQVLALNHDLDPRIRDATLQSWCAEEYPRDGTDDYDRDNCYSHDRPRAREAGCNAVERCTEEKEEKKTEEAEEEWHEGQCHDAEWFELTGAASAGLTIIALLTLACEPRCSELEIYRIYHAYFPWISALACMLDSYVDQFEDADNGNHIYISHYSSPESAIEHICQLTSRSLQGAQTLQNGATHTLIVACMVAMYLSKDSARLPEMRESTGRILAAGGSLSAALLPVLRAWRIAFSQCSH